MTRAPSTAHEQCVRSHDRGTRQPDSGDLALRKAQCVDRAAWPDDAAPISAISIQPPGFGGDVTKLNVFYLRTENGKTIIVVRATVPRN